MAEFPIPAHWQHRPSPNFNKRTKTVSAIVLHADASTRIDSSLDWCRRPESGVSYHIMVGRTGGVFWLVHPDNRAWHAGKSAMGGISNVNDFSVGVCLSNKNTGETYPAAQLHEAARVCATLCKFYNLPVERITTHAIVATPAGRKTDPLGLKLDTFRESVRLLL